MSWRRGDIILSTDGTERVYLRMNHRWTVSPNSSNWYPDDEAMDAKLAKGDAVFIGNRADYEAGTGRA